MSPYRRPPMSPSPNYYPLFPMCHKLIFHTNRRIYKCLRYLMCSINMSSSKLTCNRAMYLCLIFNKSSIKWTLGRGSAFQEKMSWVRWIISQAWCTGLTALTWTPPDINDDSDFSSVHLFHLGWNLSFLLRRNQESALPVLWLESPHFSWISFGNCKQVWDLVFPHFVHVCLCCQESFAKFQNFTIITEWIYCTIASKSIGSECNW